MQFKPIKYDSLRRHTPVIKTSGNVEYYDHIVLSMEFIPVFDNAKTLHFTNSVLHYDYLRRDIPILSLLFKCKYSSFGFLRRLNDNCSEGVSMVTDILPKLERKWESYSVSAMVLSWIATKTVGTTKWIYRADNGWVHP